MFYTVDSVRKKELVSFAGAEFEFKTAPAIINAIKETAENGLFGFTVADENYFGHVVWWMKNVRGAKILPEWILPVQGTIFSAATAIRLLTKKGDGIIALKPGYSRYEQAASRLERKMVLVPMKSTKGLLSIDLYLLEKAMRESENKMFLFSNPNNPTGQIISAETLQSILTLARKYKVALWSDEIFADVDLKGDGVPMLAALADKDDMAITVTSLGKTFSLTGMNHANVIIRNQDLRERYRIQRDRDHFGSIDPTAYAALCGGYSPEGQAWLKELVSVIKSNNAQIINFFAEHMPDVKVLLPEAGYVLWMDFSGLGFTHDELFDFLNNEAFFCCDFGEEYYGNQLTARICTAVPPKELEKCLTLFHEAGKKHGIIK